MKRIDKQRALTLVKKLVNQGKVSEAKDLLAALGRQHPKDKQIQAISRQYGRALATQTPAPLPNNVQVLLTLYQQQRFSEVIEPARELLIKTPSDKTVWNLLGICYQNLRDYGRASQAFFELVKLDSQDATSLCNYGASLLKTGEIDAAVQAFDKAISIRPDYERALINQGEALRAAGLPDRAIEVCSQALKVNPNSDEAHNNLGNALSDREFFEKAVVSYMKAIQINPDYAAAYNNLGVALQKMGKYREAIGYFESAISKKNDYAAAYDNLGVSLRYDGRLSEALSAHAAAIEHLPKFAAAYNNIAIVHATLGNTSDACEAYQKVLSLNPMNATAWRNATTLSAFPVDDEAYSFLKKQWLEVRGQQAKCEIGYALFNVCARRNDYKTAKRYLDDASSIKKSLIKYDSRIDVDMFQSLRRSEMLPMQDLCARDPDSGFLPIFIVGMPRSGTTLLEQVISSHSLVEALGELTFISDALRLQGYKNDLRVSSSDLRSYYYKQIEQKIPAGAAFTDKMPQNFLHLPILASAFPEAKFIHVYREPAATCWSIYEKYFATRGLGFSYDLATIASYYGNYVGLMQSYDQSLGERIHHINYEEFTESPAHHIRVLLNFLGLQYEDALLAPHLNNRPVATASQEQVRRPIYTGSSSRWKLFEPYIEHDLSKLREFRPSRPE